MIYPSSFENKIGFDAVRRELERHCVSTLGAANVPRLRFSTQRDEVVRWLEQTNEFLSIVQTGREFPLSYYFDLRVVLKEVATPGTFLSAERLFDLQRLLVTVTQVVRFFATDGEGNTPYPRLRELTNGMQSFPEVSVAIGSVLDKAGNIKATASPKLHELRVSIARVTSSINGTLRRIIAQGKQDGILDNDVQPSLRDGRLVLPVNAMNKRKLHGIVHDESATGKTVFIEPEAIVEANNRIRETEAEIAREIIRILTEVTDLIRPHLDELAGVLNTLGLLDFIRAKALFAQDVGAQMCHVDRKPVLEWYSAVHPALLLSLRTQGKEVVPLNIALNRQNRILVISGPNAGGKSVCLKTVGIVQYMMQCGLLPPLRDNSHMGIFRDIFIDIGDQQSIENDLSTYSSHLQNMKLFLSKGGKETLILIDEMGSGTEPQIGGAIAQSILEQLNDHQVMGVVTTHYQNLKHLPRRPRVWSTGRCSMTVSACNPCSSCQWAIPAVRLLSRLPARQVCHSKSSTRRAKSWAVTTSTWTNTCWTSCVTVAIGKTSDKTSVPRRNALTKWLPTMTSVWRIFVPNTAKSFMRRVMRRKKSCVLATRRLSVPSRKYASNRPRKSAPRNCGANLTSSSSV